MSRTDTNWFFFFYNNSIFLTVQPEKRKENKKNRIDSIWVEEHFGSDGFISLSNGSAEK